ncbi:MAG: phosphoribosyltransferase [Pseudomonadota bacterium]|nr:phosphoribosyltransferase [Pseudomonadota bacterium]
MASKIRCEMITWSEVQRLCRRLAFLIRSSNYVPDVVVAISRGGYVPARLVCDYLDIMALTSIRTEHYLSGSIKQAQVIIRDPLCADIKGLRVLIVDDVNDSGDTLELAIRHLQAFYPREIRTAVMHRKTSTHISENYYARKIVKLRWLIYPWAVKEDISGFLQRLMPAPETMEQAQLQLAEHFGILISQQRLKDIYEFMEK